MQVPLTYFNSFYRSICEETGWFVFTSEVCEGRLWESKVLSKNKVHRHVFLPEMLLFCGCFLRICQWKLDTLFFCNNTGDLSKTPLESGVGLSVMKFISLCHILSQRAPSWIFLGSTRYTSGYQSCIYVFFDGCKQSIYTICRYELERLIRFTE